MGDPLPDHSVGEALGSAFLHVTGIGARISKREADEAQLDALDGTLLTDLDREFHERGEDAGPDLGPDLRHRGRPRVHRRNSFLLIARDTFRVLQDSHTAGAPALDADIASAEVTTAALMAGRERVVVRFGINGATSISQDWTFERDPSIDTSADDEDHEVADGGWLVAHRGWRLTGIAAAA